MKVCSLDGDTNFDIVDAILRGDKSAPYLFIICQAYIIRTSIDLKKDDSFKLKKARSRAFHKETIASCKYTKPSRLSQHSLEQAAGGIGLYMNKDKTEYMCFNQEGDISTQNGGLWH